MGKELTPEEIDKLDPQIKDLVVALNILGYETMTSCQGGENHAFKLATIGFETHLDKQQHLIKINNLTEFFEKYKKLKGFHYLIVDGTGYPIYIKDNKIQPRLDYPIYTLYVHIDKEGSKIADFINYDFEFEFERINTCIFTLI